MLILYLHRSSKLRAKRVCNTFCIFNSPILYLFIAPPHWNKISPDWGNCSTFWKFRQSPINIQTLDTVYLPIQKLGFHNLCSRVKGKATNNGRPKCCFLWLFNSWVLLLLLFVCCCMFVVVLCCLLLLFVVVVVVVVVWFFGIIVIRIANLILFRSRIFENFFGNVGGHWN